jgi:predicted AAA+ superfamily ATPase
MQRRNIDRDRFFGSYIQTYLQRDVRDLAQVGNILAFQTFLQAAAARTAQMINLSDMARDCGISVPTAKHWLSILEASGLVYVLQPFYANISKRLTKTPKLYFLDTGLAAYLTRWSSPDALESGAMSGVIFETFVFTEILKSYWHNGKDAPFYYYRDQNKNEIDLLIERDGSFFPVEIKKTTRPAKEVIKTFALLEKSNIKLGAGVLICGIPQPLPFSQTITAVPPTIL